MFKLPFANGRFLTFSNVHRAPTTRRVPGAHFCLACVGGLLRNARCSFGSSPLRNACLAQGKGEHEDAEVPRHAHKLSVILAGWLVRASMRGYVRAHTHNYETSLPNRWYRISMHSSSLMVPPPSLSQIINSTRLNSRVGSRPCFRFQQEHLFQRETWAAERTRAKSHCVGLQYPAALRWTARADMRRHGRDACGHVGRDGLPCDPFDSGCTAAQSSPNLSTRWRPHPPPR